MRQWKTLWISGRAVLAVFAMVIARPANASAGVQDSSQAITLTLEKAIAMAKENNRDVLIAEQDRYKADAQITEARSAAFPQISLGGQYTRNVMIPVMFLPPGSIINPTSSTQVFEIGSSNSYIGGVQLYQTLYSRKVGVALDIARTYHEYSEQAYLATTEDVVLNVKKAFFGILLAEKLLEANRQGLDVVRANFENVQSQYRHGAAAEFDQLRAEVQLANTEPLVVSAENDLILAQYALKNLLGIPLESPLRIEGDFSFSPVSAEDLAQWRQNSIAANPSIAELALQESILDMNISVERANYFPTLSLVGSYQWQSQDNGFRFKNYLWANTLAVGVQLSVTLFDGLRTNARIDQASFEKEEVHFARLKAEEGLRIQIQSAELKMTEAQKRIEGQEKNIAQAEKAVHIAQTRFKSGVGTQLELLDTQVAMTRAQTNYAMAIYDFLVAKTDWQRAVGDRR